jgi:two-component system, NtrC family, nitrogen regulation response regulator NtrX
MTKHILIADDNEDMRQALAQLLELEGFSIAGAPDCDSALGLAQQVVYDLILLDASLSGAGGQDLLAGLQRLLPLAPIIMMSGGTNRNMVNNALRGGARDFISKPFEDEHVLRTVKRALGIDG